MISGLSKQYFCEQECNVVKEIQRRLCRSVVWAAAVSSMNQNNIVVTPLPSDDWGSAAQGTAAMPAYHQRCHRNPTKRHKHTHVKALDFIALSIWFSELKVLQFFLC